MAYHGVVANPGQIAPVWTESSTNILQESTIRDGMVFGKALRTLTHRQLMVALRLLKSHLLVLLTTFNDFRPLLPNLVVLQALPRSKCLSKTPYSKAFKEGRQLEEATSSVGDV
jgi:hypothetical protein